MNRILVPGKPAPPAVPAAKIVQLGGSEAAPLDRSLNQPQAQKGTAEQFGAFSDFPDQFNPAEGKAKWLTRLQGHQTRRPAETNVQHRSVITDQPKPGHRHFIHMAGPHAAQRTEWPRRLSWDAIKIHGLPLVQLNQLSGRKQVMKIGSVILDRNSVFLQNRFI